MGALASLTPWTPGDDFLLKNAVEAGASLESLAKGAVQFSQKFTFRELQDRWYSLLYDPVISAESSGCMINFERSASSPPSKFNKHGYSTNKRASVKRKANSVRNCYYSLRKKIWDDQFSSMDLSFLVAPNDVNYGGEPLSTNCMTEDPVANYFGPQGSNMDTAHCDFPENLMDRGITAHAFYTEVENPVVEHFHGQQNSIHAEFPPILGETLFFDENASGVEELDGSKELAVDNLFGTDGFGDINFSTLDHINTDPRNMCSEMNGNQVFDSPMSECGTSFDKLDLPPLPGMPIWRTAEGIQEPAMQHDVGLTENDPCIGDIPHCPDDEAVDDISTSGLGVEHSESKVEPINQCNGDLRSSIASRDGFFAELSNSLLDIPNDEELLFLIAGKDGFDKSYEGLRSLLKLPSDVNQDHTPKATEAETLVAPHAYITYPHDSCPGEVDDNIGSCSSDGHVVHRSDIQVPSSAKALYPECPRLTGEKICILNTEDPEIPSNDDVFLPYQSPPSSFPLSSQQSFQETYNPVSSSVEDVGANHRNSDSGIGLTQMEQKILGESHVSSHMVGSPLPEGVLCHHVSACKVKFESSSHAPHVGYRGEVIGHSSSTGINLANASTKAPIHAKLKEEVIDVALTKSLSSNSRNSFVEKTACGSKSSKNYPLIDASGMKPVKDAAVTIQDHQVVHAEVGSADATVSDPVVNCSTSDQEVLDIESDDDVPQYSDIEAMILDMDLDPDDQDLCSSKEVSRYQHEDTKRAIIRLEQGAHSYMQRAIASHGAFAVLYGRYSKHYIKKSEVLLGRASKDVIVDIDLSGEGSANKISRRQAIIKMDEVGSFYLTNLGMCSISVNNKDVPSGQSIHLQSGCLIEMRGMPFIFETNQDLVNQYLNSITEHQTHEYQL